MKLTAIKHILGSCFIQLFFRKSVCVFILRVYGLKIIIFVKTYLELKVNFSIETMINRNRPQLISWKGGRDSFPAVLSAQQDHLVLQSSVAVCTLGETWPWGGGGLGPAGAAQWRLLYVGMGVGWCSLHHNSSRRHLTFSSSSFSDCCQPPIFYEIPFYVSFLHRVFSYLII